MPFFVFFMLLFIVLALVWVVAAGLLIGTFFAGTPRFLERVFDYKGPHCVCHFRRHA